MARPRPTFQTLKATVGAFCIDLNGTVHVGNDILPGAKEAIERLVARKRNFRFVTNTSKESRRVLIERMNNFGLHLTNNDVYSSLTATRDVVLASGLRPILFANEEAMEDFEGISSENPNAVVVALSPENFNYEKLNIAFRLLLANPDAPLIAVHKGRYLKIKDGHSLGPGPFVTALEFAAQKEAMVIGKPNKDFYLGLVNGMNATPATSIMIGDDVRDDVIGALQLGMYACLVKTGKYREGDELTEYIPVGETTRVKVAERALVVDSLADVVNGLVD